MNCAAVAAVRQAEDSKNSATRRLPFSRRISELSESYGGDKLSVWTDSVLVVSTERKDNVAQIVDFGMPLQTRLVNVYAYRSTETMSEPKPGSSLSRPGGKKQGNGRSVPYTVLIPESRLPAMETCFSERVPAERYRGMGNESVRASRNASGKGLQFQA